MELDTNTNNELLKNKTEDDFKRSVEGRTVSSSSIEQESIVLNYYG